VRVDKKKGKATSTAAILALGGEKRRREVEKKFQSRRYLKTGWNVTKAQEGAQEES